MSYASRERKRAERSKRRMMVGAARSNRTEDTARRWFLRNAKRDGRCAARGCRFRRGDVIVYRREGKVTLCRLCAEADPVVWPQVRLSADFELRNVKRAKAGPAWMREAQR
jgi:hypothetical protein